MYVYVENDIVRVQISLSCKRISFFVIFLYNGSRQRDLTEKMTKYGILRIVRMHIYSNMFLDILSKCCRLFC